MKETYSPAAQSLPTLPDKLTKSMKNIFIIIAFIFINNYCYSQNENINYVEYTYKHLDKNFKIKISDKDYQETVDKYGFYRERAIGKSYKDSLLVVLSKEFGEEDTQKVNYATYQIAYSWERVAYHLWISAEDSKEFAKKYNFKHPYLFMLFLRKSDNNDDKYIKELFAKLRVQVINHTKDERVKNFSNSQLMDFAMYNSPKRIKDFQDLVEQKPDKNWGQLKRLNY